MSGDKLGELVGETVVVEMMNGNRYAGELKSVEDDFSLTLTENGGPEPDDDEFVMADGNYKNLVGERVFNGKNVESVQPLDDYRDGFFD